jgi:chromosome segregation ATPase
MLIGLVILLTLLGKIKINNLTKPFLMYINNNQVELKKEYTRVIDNLETKYNANYIKLQYIISKIDVAQQNLVSLESKLKMLSNRYDKYVKANNINESKQVQIEMTNLSKQLTCTKQTINKFQDKFNDVNELNKQFVDQLHNLKNQRLEVLKQVKSQ